MSALEVSSGEQPANGFAALAALLHLARRAREAASTAELGFVAVNETRELVAYRQSVLWADGTGVVALSGVVAPEANTPYLLWLKSVVRRVASADFSALDSAAAAAANEQTHEQADEPVPQQTPAAADPLAPVVFTAADMPPDVAAEWAEWLPECAVWLPFSNKGMAGGWLLARDEPWTEAELPLLREWLALWFQAWQIQHASDHADSPWRKTVARLQALQALRVPRDEWRPRLQTFGRQLRDREAWRAAGRWLKNTRQGRITLAVVLVLLFPVRLSVIAPGQLVAANPSVIRSPLDGIVEKILVQPSQRVQVGTPLVEFDRISLASRLEVALQALATAEAEYRQYAQQALSDPKAKAQMASAQGRIEEKRAEVTYLDALNKRAILTAPREGIVLLDDPSEWVGRPVSTGERILMVADEKDAEIEAWLSPGDLIELPEDAQATIFLNARPLSPLSGAVRYVTHEAILQPEGNYAYRLRAKLSPGEDALRVGLKGSVKVNGRFVPFSYWVMRKPLAVARALIGF
jgi:biotin carboxyl carrier protein